MSYQPDKLTEAPEGYAGWLGYIKAQIHEARQRASQALNLELVALYWRIGRAILDRQDQQGWGAKVIDRLAHDLRTNFPEMKGFSPRNLKYMRAFAGAWPESEIVQVPLGHLEGGAIVQQPLHKLGPGEMMRKAGAQIEAGAFIQQATEPFVQAHLHKLPWYHHIALLDKLNTREEREWYLRKALEHNWSRNILVIEIERELAGGDEKLSDDPS